MMLPPTGQLGGFYMYLDNRDRAVLGDAANHVLQVAHHRGTSGAWAFQVTGDWDVTGLVTGHCGSAGCDYVESVAPDLSGRIWFSTAGGVVGVVDPATGTAHAVTLPAGEVANSISTATAGVAVASDHAVYLLRARPGGTPAVVAREPYDRGSGQKRGQLSWGTGSTPASFGPGGNRYLTIADNADSQEHLLVYRIDPKTGALRLICRTPIFTPGASAAETQRQDAVQSAPGLGGRR